MQRRLRELPRHLGVLLLLTSLAAGCSAPAPRTIEDRVQAIAGEIWSPYCPGRVLTDCPTRQAQELRNEIRERLVAGEADAEVLAAVHENLGPGSRARPGSDAAGIVAWIVPIAALLVGLGLVVARLARRPVRDVASGAPTDP